jgi:hypothetical protein
MSARIVFLARSGQLVVGALLLTTSTVLGQAARALALAHIDCQNGRAFTICPDTDMATGRTFRGRVVHGMLTTCESFEQYGGDWTRH